MSTLYSGKNRRPLKRRRSGGMALIEFAICFTTVWLLFSGVFGFGQAFYTYGRLLTLVNGAAKMGAKLAYDTTNPNNFATQVKNMVLYGDTVAGTTPLIHGLNASHVHVDVGTDAYIMPRDVTVSIEGFTIDTVFYHIQLSGKPRAVMMYTGRVTCPGCI